MHRSKYFNRGKILLMSLSESFLHSLYSCLILAATSGFLHSSIRNQIIVVALVSKPAPKNPNVSPAISSFVNLYILILITSPSAVAPNNNRSRMFQSFSLLPFFMFSFPFLMVDSTRSVNGCKVAFTFGDSESIPKRLHKKRGTIIRYWAW